MNIDDQLQNEVLNETDIPRLYEIQIDLSRIIANCHRSIITAQTSLEQSELKGSLGIYMSIRDVLQNRLIELKEAEREQKNERQRIDYNFRMACKTILKKETYQKAMQLAMQSRREVKDKQQEFRNNKIE